MDNFEVAVSNPGVCCYSGVKTHCGGGRGRYVLPFVLSVIQRVKVSLYVTSDAKGIYMLLLPIPY